VRPQFEPAVAQGEAGRGDFRRDRVHLAERRLEIGYRGGRARPAVPGDVGGQPADGVAERARERQLALGRVSARTVNPDGVEPCVHVGGRAEVIVAAVRVRPDRAHQAHRQRFIGQDPGALGGRDALGGRRGGNG
jgi:hypothetical protein